MRFVKWIVIKPSGSPVFSFVGDNAIEAKKKCQHFDSSKGWKCKRAVIKIRGLVECQKDNFEGTKTIHNNRR